VRGEFVAFDALIVTAPVSVPACLPLGSADTVIVDGAVPLVADKESQGTVGAAVHESVPAPEFVMLSVCVARVVPIPALIDTSVGDALITAAGETVSVTPIDCGELLAPAAVSAIAPVKVPGFNAETLTLTVAVVWPLPVVGETVSHAAFEAAVHGMGGEPVVVMLSDCVAGFVPWNAVNVSVEAETLICGEAAAGNPAVVSELEQLPSRIAVPARRMPRRPAVPERNDMETMRGRM
jgi:hypothetical protein